MRWQFPEHNFDGDVVERLLQARGLLPEQYETFLNPGPQQIHDAGLLSDIEAAAQIILDAVKQKKKIFIHGDYDVDGVCATSILWLFLARELHADVLPKIPNRFDEGYGLSPATLDDIVAQGGKLVITVDCGIKDGELISKYKKESGLEFVVTDHHAISEPFAEGVPVVHPRNPSAKYPFPDICGAAVAWKLCQFLARKSGMEDFLPQYLDLVALATSCDVMPLVDENRAIVRLGMAEMRKAERPGIAALLEVSGVKPAELKTYHLGFVIGPKLNAAGRIQDAMVAVRLLSTESLAKARELAQELNQLNIERQALTQTLLESAEEQISKFPKSDKLYFVYGDEWPEGVVGLVAGKLTEKYGRPVLVASRSAEGIIKGSARSIKPFHITDALGKSAEYLMRFGGHAMAAGVTLEDKKLTEFTTFLNSIANESISDEDLVPLLNIDLKLDLAEVRPSLVDNLKQLEPFGFGNPNPTVAVMDIMIGRAPRIFGNAKQHIAFVVEDESGSKVEVIDWGGSQRWQHLKSQDKISVAGSLGVNEWNGIQTPQIVAKDIQLLDDSQAE